MGIAAMIRRLRQQDALDAACEAIERKGHRIVQQATAIELKDGIIGAQASKIEFLEKTEVPRLEAEILRLRKNALTPPAEKVDNSIVQAKSTADVRRLTEAAFGLELREALNHQGEEAHDS
jgi:hypothetical protein